jgi:hypothetical protein
MTRATAKAERRVRALLRLNAVVHKVEQRRGELQSLLTERIHRLEYDDWVSTPGCPVEFYGGSASRSETRKGR